MKGNVYMSWTAQYIHAVSAFFFFVLLNGHLGSSLHWLWTVYLIRFGGAATSERSDDIPNILFLIFCEIKWPWNDFKMNYHISWHPLLILIECGGEKIKAQELLSTCAGKDHVCPYAWLIMVLVVLMTTQSLELTCVLRCVHRFSKILVMQDIKQKERYQNRDGHMLCMISNCRDFTSFPHNICS